MCSAKMLASQQVDFTGIEYPLPLKRKTEPTSSWRNEEFCKKIILEEDEVKCLESSLWTDSYVDCYGNAIDKLKDLTGAFREMKPVSNDSAESHVPTWISEFDSSNPTVGHSSAATNPFCNSSRTCNFYPLYRNNSCDCPSQCRVNDYVCKNFFNNSSGAELPCSSDKCCCHIESAAPCPPVSFPKPDVWDMSALRKINSRCDKQCTSSLVCCSKFNQRKSYSHQRLVVLNLSMHKLSRFRQAPEPSLHKSVLICNTLKLIEKEMEREGIRFRFADTSANHRGNNIIKLDAISPTPAPNYTMNSSYSSNVEFSHNNFQKLSNDLSNVDSFSNIAEESPTINWCSVLSLSCQSEMESALSPSDPCNNLLSSSQDIFKEMEEESVDSWKLTPLQPVRSEDLCHLLPLAPPSLNLLKPLSQVDEFDCLFEVLVGT